MLTLRGEIAFLNLIVLTGNGVAGERNENRRLPGD